MAEISRIEAMEYVLNNMNEFDEYLLIDFYLDQGRDNQLTEMTKELDFIPEEVIEDYLYNLDKEEFDALL